MMNFHSRILGPEQGSRPGLGLGAMEFYIMLCTVHTRQGQGTIVFYCARPSPCPGLGLGPGPAQCV